MEGCFLLMYFVANCFVFHLILDCYYDGILHEHGERWSPGPCTPECKCDDGKIRCTLIECPELSCSNPIKKRWKCCPECPVKEGENNGVRVFCFDRTLFCNRVLIS